MLYCQLSSGVSVYDDDDGQYELHLIVAKACIDRFIEPNTNLINESLTSGYDIMVVCYIAIDLNHVL